MRARRTAPLLLLGLFLTNTRAADLPRVADGWTIELVKQAPEILYPTAIVCDRQGTIYLGQDPMDMPGPPTVPADSVVTIDPKGKLTVFADKLWAVMGLEYDEVEETLYVVHPPFLSAFRDTNHDGKADKRIDLMTGLGPKLPGFSGINDHVASGIRLGMDGFLYISVGDKGIPHGVGKDGKTIQLFGGGVIRIRPDGSDLEVVSTGERNPLSVALSPTDEIFTYGNDDDSKKWPNSLTHHIVGGHYGYPYQFLNAPNRCLPITAGQLGGSGAQAVFNNEPCLPDEYYANLFVCDWGLQTVFRYQVERKGATFEVKSRTPLVSRGDVADFRPFSICLGQWDGSVYLVDWAFNGWLASEPKTGRLYRLSHKDARGYPVPPLFEPLPEVKLGADEIAALKALKQPIPDLAGEDVTKDPLWIETLDHPSRLCRLYAQRGLVKFAGKKALPLLIARLRKPEPVWGRMHAIWALDALDEPEGRAAIREVLLDPERTIRCQAVRCVGISRDQKALPGMLALLKDKEATIRREAAIALGKLAEHSAAPPLLAALGDPDTFVAWSIRHAIRAIGSWDTDALTAALLDPKRQDDALKLCDEAWALPVVEALNAALPKIESEESRARGVAILAGLYRKYPKWSGQWFGTNPLAGAFPQKTEPWAPAAMARVQSGLTLALKDAKPAVRLQAIAGLIVVGRPAAAVLRGSLLTETDPNNLAAIAQGLGVLVDFDAAQPLGALALNASKPEPVRLAALDALGRLRGPHALTARISVVYDPNAPAALLARALPSLGREGIIPPNDLAGFLEHADASVRAAALMALTSKKALPADIGQSVLTKLNDPKPEVRSAAVEAIVAHGMREAVPALLAAALNESTRSEATRALAALPDRRALPVYLAGLSDRGPDLRQTCEGALRELGDSIRPDLEAAARTGKFDGPAALAMERLLNRFKPITEWKVIGPFARTTARVFLGERSIDFDREYSGAEGRSLNWNPLRADPLSGRVVIDHFKGGAGDVGGFGYDTNGSPDLAAFGFAEFDSDRDREALMLVGSSGSLKVTVNEQIVLEYTNFAGRAYQPDSDLVRIKLLKGKNRILVMSRQGVAAWSFGVQISEPSTITIASAGKSADPESLRTFAMSHEGDPRSGEALFFDARGVGCVKCHAANGQGSANFGPDLTGLALKYDKAEIVRSVLEPSNRIATGYQPVVIATRDGKVINGLIRSETDDSIELVDSETKVIRIAKGEIEERKVGAVSVMPAKLVDSLSLVEFADLVSYLQSLKTPPAPTGRPSQDGSTPPAR